MKPDLRVMAAAASLLVPGLGQALGGRPIRGLALHLADVALALGLWLEGFLPDLGLPGLGLSLLLLAGFRAAVAADAARGAGGPPRWWAAGAVLAVMVAGDPVITRLVVTRGPATIWTYRTDTPSMVPALRPGETLVARLQPFEPRVGDVVVFGAPEGFGHPGSHLLIKRVVAVAGEHVEIRDGRLLVDGLPRPTPWWRGRPMEPTGPWALPPGSLFVVGDNLRQSEDSRRFGPIAREAVVGQALYVLSSPEPRRIGLRL